MYSTRTTPRLLKVNTIENLPLAEIAATYGALMSASAERWAQAREDYAEAVKTKHDKTYSSVSEAPYEGDYEELNLPSLLDLKFGSTCRSLGSVEQLELDAYLASFATKYNIKKNAEWFFEQMVAKFSEVTLHRTPEGLVDPIAVFKEIRQSPFVSGCLVIALQNSRSNFITGQTDPRFRNYGALVPLVMSAFKKYRNTPYNSWSRAGLQNIVAPNLYAAMTIEEMPDATREEVIDARNTALTPKSGAKMGIMQNPATTYRLYIPADSALAGMPQLGQIMMCQTWLAHPTNRTEYMILNPTDWDNIPPDLISGSITRPRVLTANKAISDW